MTQAAHNRWKWIVGGLFLFLLTAITIWQCVHIHEQAERIAALESQQQAVAKPLDAGVSDLAKRIQHLEQQQKDIIANNKQAALKQTDRHATQLNAAQIRQEIHKQYRQQQQALKEQCDQLSNALAAQTKTQIQQTKQIASAVQEIAVLHSALQKSAAQLNTLNTQQHNWSDWYAAYADRLFLCLAINPQTGSVGIGTAFMYDTQRSLLATNAHIVQLLRAMPQRMIIQNKTGRVFTLKRAAHNPLFVTLTSPDVGLLEIDTEGTQIAAMPLATEKDLQSVVAGLSIGSIGFPGELQKQYQDAAAETYPGVLATFKQGWVGRVSDYDGVTKSTRENVLIQHSASLSSGTSGSPIFNQDGLVIAVSSSSMTSSFKVGHLRTRELLSAAEIAFAIRIDELQRFAASATLQTLPIKE